MAGNATLVFSCCHVEDPGACIEYSWVPTGVRHVIKLAGRVIAASTDMHANVTHVQVYSLRNGNYGQAPTANGWQFPPGPPPSGKHLAGAVVHIDGHWAYGYGLYDDGTASPVDRLQLLHVGPFECGEGDGTK